MSEASAQHVLASYGTRRLQTTVLSDGEAVTLVRRWADGQPARRPVVEPPVQATAEAALLRAELCDGALVYRGAGPASLVELMPRLLERQGAAAAWARAAGATVCGLHHPLASGRPGTARLERMADLWREEGDNVAAAAARGLLVRWQSDLGDRAWREVGETLDALLQDGRDGWWILGDAALAGLRCTGPLRLRALLDGHAGRGPRELDAGLLLGELVELRKIAGRRAGGGADAELAAAVRAFTMTLPDDLERPLVRRVAAGRILLHALDYLEFVGWDDELRDYGALAREAL